MSLVESKRTPNFLLLLRKMICDNNSCKMTSWSQGRGWEKIDKREIVTYIYFQKEKQMANCILYCIFVGFNGEELSSESL